MKLFLDTNIILDFFLAREPYAETVLNLFQTAQEKNIPLYISASSATDIFYLLHKNLKDKDQALAVFGDLLKIVHIADVLATTIFEAYNLGWTDFEDAVQYCAAQNITSDSIITRNKKDFSFSSIPVYTPEDFLNQIIS